MKKRWNATVAALVVGLSMGLAGSLGFAQDVPVQESCGRNECRSDSDCTSICGGPGSCVQVDSCNRICACAM